MCECVFRVVIRGEGLGEVKLYGVCVSVCVFVSVCLCVYQFSLCFSSLSHTCVSMKECVWVISGAPSGESSSWPLVPGLSWQMSE